MIFFVCVVGVWQRNFEPLVCVPGTTSWDVMKVDFTTYFTLSRQSFNQAHHFGEFVCYMCILLLLVQISWVFLFFIWLGVK